MSTVSRRPRALDEDVLDELCERLGELPEPVAAVAAGVEVARADGDASGVRMRLFELGIAVVRYAVSVGLALAQRALDGARAPTPLATALGGAVRLSDGQWCGLLRTLADQLRQLGVPAAERFAFATARPLAELVTERNRFVHGGGFGERAPELVLGVLEAAEPLLSLPVRVVVTLEPPSYQERVGVPLRPGVWRKHRKPTPSDAVEGEPYLVIDESWVRLSPWLPWAERKLVLLDSPHAPGKPWRWYDSETGEHQLSPEVDAAVHALVGDASAPVPPSDVPGLVGRRDLLATMRRAADMAHQGGIGVLLFTGPQGIGRGRMLRTLRDLASQLGFGWVIDASCSPQRRGVLRPLRRAVSELPGLEALRDALSRASFGDALAGAAGLEAAVEAVEEVLVETSLREPVLLLLDDAQWADEPTLSLLGSLTERATRQGRGKLLVAVTVRDEPRPPAALTHFVGEVERDVGPGATRLPLTPLAPDEARRLVQGVAPVDTRIEAQLVDGAAGVPFLMVQPLLGWFETGALSWEGGAWHASSDEVLSAPPPAVADVVRARIASFFDGDAEHERCASQVMLCVGLCGGWMRLDALLAVLEAVGWAHAPVEHALEVLTEAGLLCFRREGREYGFAQPMVRQAVVDDLQRKPWSSRVHAALLARLAEEGDDEDASFLAEGFLGLGDVAAASKWLRRAVGYALDRGMFREAVGWADRWRAVGEPDDRGRAQLAAIDALVRAGEVDEARARFGALPRLDEPALSVRADILALALGQRDVDAGALLVAADALGEAELAVEARFAVARQRRAARGLALLDEALPRLPADEPTDLRYRVLMLRGELLYETEGLETAEARTALVEARQVAEALGSAWAMIDADNDLAALQSAAGNHQEAIATLRRVVAEAKAQRFGRLKRGAMLNLGSVLLRADQVAGAAAAATGAVDEARAAGDRRLLGTARSVQASALERLDRLDEAREAVDEAVAIRLQDGDPNVPIALLRRAELSVRVGDAAAARRDAEQGAAIAEAAGNADLLARCRLWLGLHDAEAGTLSVDALRRLTDEVAATGKLRGPTKELLEQARARCAG